MSWQIVRPDDLTDLASLGLTLAEGKRLLAGVQQEIIAAQARVHAVRRPECRSCGTTCRVRDYRQHAIATLFGLLAIFDDHAASRKRGLSRSRPARPYMVRFSIWGGLIGPPRGPLPQPGAPAARTAS